MPTLYTLADSNTRKTWIYLSAFFLLIIGLGWLTSYLFDSRAILWLAVILSVASSFASYWYSDKIVLAMSRARPIEKKDAAELYRIVENLSITAGLPMPKVYLIEEPQPNAFATGRNPEHAVVAVTSGLLKALERSELEAVIAHELAHIGNRDTLLATLVVVLVGTVVIITDLFLRSRSWRGDSRNGKDKLSGIIMLLSLAALILAPLLAQLLRFAISRKREFLADADGALLTRYPEGLARALEKIAQSGTPLRHASNATAHLYIVNPFRGRTAQNRLVKLFSTHPPVEERVKALRETRG